MKRKRKSSKIRSLRKFYQQERYSILIMMMAMTQMFVATSHQSASLFTLSIMMILTTLFLNWWKQQKQAKRRRVRFPRRSRSRRRNPSYGYSYDVYDYGDNYPLIPLPPLKRKREYRQ